MMLGNTPNLGFVQGVELLHFAMVFELRADQVQRSLGWHRRQEGPVTGMLYDGVLQGLQQSTIIDI